MLGNKAKILKDTFLNVLSNKFYELSYVIEFADWSIKRDGQYITENLNRLNLIKARTTRSHLGLKGQIIHFGSVNTFLKEKGFCKPDSSNQTILTWFHFVPGDKKIKIFWRVKNT